jgi:Ca-activated chloride channel family protein
MNPEELEPQITSYLLGELEPEAAEAVRKHLEESPGSRALATEIGMTLDLMRGALAAEPGVPVRLDDERKAQIRQSDTPNLVLWITEHYRPLLQVAAVLVVVVGLALIMSRTAVKEDRLAAVAQGDSGWERQSDRSGRGQRGATESMSSFDDSGPAADITLTRAQERPPLPVAAPPATESMPMLENGSTDLAGLEIATRSGESQNTVFYDRADLDEDDREVAQSLKLVDGNEVPLVLVIDDVTGAVTAGGVARDTFRYENAEEVQEADANGWDSGEPDALRTRLLQDGEDHNFSMDVALDKKKANELEELHTHYSEQGSDADGDAAAHEWFQANSRRGAKDAEEKQAKRERGRLNAPSRQLAAEGAEGEIEARYFEMKAEDLESFGLEGVAADAPPVEEATARALKEIIGEPHPSGKGDVVVVQGGSEFRVNKDTGGKDIVASEDSLAPIDFDFTAARPPPTESVKGTLGSLDETYRTQPNSIRVEYNDNVSLPELSSEIELGRAAAARRPSPVKMPVSPKPGLESATEVGAQVAGDHRGLSARSSAEPVASNGESSRKFIQLGRDPNYTPPQGTLAEQLNISQAEVDRLGNIILPSLDFRNKQLPDVLTELNEQMTAADPDGKGVKLRIGPGFGFQLGVSNDVEQKTVERAGGPAEVEELGAFVDASGEIEVPRITLTLREISAIDALQIVSEYADLEIRGDGDELILLPKEPLVEPEPLAEPAEVDSRESVFRAYSFNPYVATLDNPFSTFAIDADTASYTLSRQYILGGRLPPADAVRTEEFVNFFNYDDPPPSHGVFAVHTQLSRTPFGEGELLRIGVKGKRLGREEQRPAVLTFIVDSSGSMDTPERLGLVRESLELLIDQLEASDQVAIVQVDSKARLVLPHVPASDRERILAAINGIQCSGSTHLEEGITVGYAVATRGFQAGAENRVLILSDGVANLGADEAGPILDRVEASRKQGIHCSVFGFGTGSYNDALLEQFANKGDGVYRFIDSKDEARRIFVDELGATLHLIAKDVKIQVEFNPDRVRQYRQIGYENRALTKEEFRDDTVDAGEVGSGQAVTALYELIPGGDPKQPLGFVRVRYQDIESGEVEEISQPIQAAEQVAAFEETGPRFRLAAAVAEFAEILRGSPYAEGSTAEDVAKVLRPVALELSLDQHVQELVRLVQAADGMPR